MTLILTKKIILMIQKMRMIAIMGLINVLILLVGIVRVVLDVL